MGQKSAAFDSQGNITAFYDSVDSPVPAGVVNTIEITQEQWQTCLVQPGQWRVVSGALAQVPSPSAAQLLSAAQAAQSSTISSACAAAIVAGLPSSALGTTHTYPSKITDQQNLASSVLDAVMALASPAWTPSTEYAAGSIRVSGLCAYKCIVGGTSGAAAPAWPTSAGMVVNDGTAQWQLWTTPFWCSDASGSWAWADHTASQIQQVGRDVKSAILALQVKKASLDAQIAACATVADVQAVTWQ